MATSLFLSFSHVLCGSRKGVQWIPIFPCHAGCGTRFRIFPTPTAPHTAFTCRLLRERLFTQIPKEMHCSKKLCTKFSVLGRLGRVWNGVFPPPPYTRSDPFYYLTIRERNTLPARKTADKFPRTVVTGHQTAPSRSSTKFPV